MMNELCRPSPKKHEDKTFIDCLTLSKPLNNFANLLISFSKYNVQTNKIGRWTEINCYFWKLSFMRNQLFLTTKISDTSIDYVNYVLNYQILTGIIL